MSVMGIFQQFDHLWGLATYMNPLLSWPSEYPNTAIDFVAGGRPRNSRTHRVAISFVICAALVKSRFVFNPTFSALW